MKLTFSYEWEIACLNRKLLPLDKNDISEIVFDIRNSFKNNETGYDFIRYFSKFMLEFRPGILSSLKECEEITEKFFEKLKEIKKQKEIIFYSSGTYPLSGDTIGLHIHIGTFFDFEKPLRFENSLLNYIPLFIAISANSPVYTSYYYGKYKSYRVIFQAWGASARNRFENHNLRFFDWGTDICDKLIEKPTIEIRVFDAPMFYKLIPDFIFFTIGAFLLNDEEMNEKRYNEYLLNRINSAKYGLSATVKWKGRERKISDVILEKIEKIEKRFSKKLNYRFKYLPLMVSKRINMADFTQKIFNDVNKDILNFMILNEKMFFEGGFEKFLKNSKAKESEKRIKFEEILFDFLENKIHFVDLYFITGIPVLKLYRMLKKLEKKGKIRIKKDERFGILILI